MALQIKIFLENNISYDHIANRSSSRRKESWMRNSSVFDDLYDRKMLSSLGRKIPKPEIPKSVFPKSRMSYVKLNRPFTAVIGLTRKRMNQFKESSGKFLYWIYIREVKNN